MDKKIRKGIIMNFVFISPQFPKTYWQFCDRLKRHGVNVLAIGDTPYYELSDQLIRSVTEYYRVDNMEDYNQVVKAMGYFIHRYGKIDWLESNNEYWLEMDARLRTDFNIHTGMHSDRIQELKLKSAMKAYYEKAGVKTARYHLPSTYELGKAFVDEVGYPVVVKPDNGVGAAKTYRIDNDDMLKQFYDELDDIPYIMEEFINGIIISYDGIADSHREPLFETSHVFPEPIMNVVNESKDMSYYSLREIPAELKKLGRSVVKNFDTERRFFHCEFFQLSEDKEGLGKKGDFVGLEVNLRAPGGYTPDMMNFANDIDVYNIYADMVCYDTSYYDREQRPYHCVYASRKDGLYYTHSHQEILDKYYPHMVMCERMPDILSGAMGNQMYTARFETLAEVQEFIEFIHC